MIAEVLELASHVVVLVLLLAAGGTAILLGRFPCQVDQFPEQQRRRLELVDGPPCRARAKGNIVARLERGTGREQGGVGAARHGWGTVVTRAEWARRAIDGARDVT